MDADTVAVRHFITQYFDDNELNDFCADYFREVYEDFSIGMGKRQKVHNLVEYCYRHGSLPDLLVALEWKRPALYNKYFLASTIEDELLENTDFRQQLPAFDVIQQRMYIVLLIWRRPITSYSPSSCPRAKGR